MGSPRRRHAERSSPARAGGSGERGAGDGGAGDGDDRLDAARLDVVELRSFEDLYRTEWGPIVGLAYTLTGSRSVAEDLAQEAMLRAYRDWARLSSFDKPATWVRRVLLNLAASRWRRQRSATKAMLRWHVRTDVVELSQTATAVWEAVRRLPRRQAEAIALHYGCDLSVDDIADTMGCAAGTVRTHLVRGRAALAIALGEEQR